MKKKDTKRDIKKCAIAELLLDVVYPRRCPICHDIVQPKGELVCCSCAGKIQPIQEPYCKKCGKPIEKEEREYCADCARREHIFEEAAGIFIYDQTMQKSLMKCKYGGRREYLDYYGQMMARHGAKFLKRWQPQAIVPIPLHKTRMCLRGFNQSAELAHALGRELGIPVQEHMLEKNRKTRPQKELEENQRRRNLLGAFSLGKDFHPLRRIVLVDDVYTTGSTVDEAAKCLKKAGAGKIYVLTLCTGKGFSTRF